MCPIPNIWRADLFFITCFYKYILSFKICRLLQTFVLISLKLFYILIYSFKHFKYVLYFTYSFHIRYVSMLTYLRLRYVSCSYFNSCRFLNLCPESKYQKLSGIYIDWSFPLKYSAFFILLYDTPYYNIWIMGD